MSAEMQIHLGLEENDELFVWFRKLCACAPGHEVVGVVDVGQVAFDAGWRASACHRTRAICKYQKRASLIYWACSAEWRLSM
jgi:hypothetical protein